MQASTFAGVFGPAQVRAIAEGVGVTVAELTRLLSPLAGLYAIVPISGYKVGAVALGASGALYYGANLEVAGQALSFTLHAEQAAIANAWLHDETGVAALGITAAPCGYCRQFLNELARADQLEIRLCGEVTSAKLSDYLPNAFGPGDLGITGALLRPVANGLRVDQPLEAAGKAALDAANAAYCPYTSTFAGLALRTSRGLIVTGRSAENAAYNPCLSPLAAALSQLNFNGAVYADIVEAVLVEAEGKASQLGVTRALLGSVSNVPLTYIRAAKA
jgi:cytidine deaminase